MELRHLRYFMAVGLEENVTKAAEKLHVSQPALSRQIRDLEEELGFELLKRSAKSVALTEAGRVFLDEAGEVLERLEQGIKAARQASLGSAGEIHVGYAPSLTVRILPPTLRAFQQSFPKVRVKLHDLSSIEMREGLRSGELDMAFMLELDAKKGRSLKFKPLKEERLRLAVSNMHPWASDRRVAMSSVVDESLIGFSLSEYPEYGIMVRDVLSQAGKDEVDFVEQHESVSSLVTSVEAGIGVSLVTESLACVASGRLTLLELDPEPSPLYVGLAWSKEVLNVRENAFLDEAERSCAGENLK